MKQGKVRLFHQFLYGVVSQCEVGYPGYKSSTLQFRIRLNIVSEINIYGERIAEYAREDSLSRIIV